MSVRKEAVESLVVDLKESSLFNVVFKNTVPIWTSVHRLPAVAIVYSEEAVDHRTITNTKATYHGKILIYIYNKQSPNQHEDILTDLIEEVQRIVKDNEYLRCNTISSILSNMKRDGGTVHPYAIAQLTLDIKYSHRV